MAIPPQCFTLASSQLFAYTEAVSPLLVPYQNALHWLEHFGESQMLGIVVCAVVIAAILFREAGEYRRNARGSVHEHHHLRGPRIVNR
jgi:hypothetical protein